MISLAVRAAVSVTVVWLLLTHVPFGEVLAALRRVNPLVPALTAVIMASGHYVNAIKFRMLLGQRELKWASGPLTSACVRAQYAGLAGNLGLPGLAGGDLVRAAYLTPIVGVKRVAIASVADRVLDTVSTLTLVAVALPFAGVPASVTGQLREAGIWVAIALAIGAVAGVILLKVRRDFADRLRAAFVHLASRKSLVASAFSLSLVVQTAFVLTGIWIARQVGDTTALAAWFVGWPVSKLIAVLPISLAGLGVREAALVVVLALYGAAREPVLSSGILWQAVFVVIGVFGFGVTQLLPRVPVVSPAGSERNS